MPRRSALSAALAAAAFLAFVGPSRASEQRQASADACRRSLVELVATKLRDRNLAPATVGEMDDMTIVELGAAARRGPEFVEIRCSGGLREIKLSFAGRYPPEAGRELAVALAASLNRDDGGDWSEKLVRKCLTYKDNASLFHDIAPPLRFRDHGVEIECRNVKWDRADPSTPISLQIEIRNEARNRAARS
jgi:hypothetical protein